MRARAVSSQEQLHPREDFLGAVLRKDESEKRRHRRERLAAALGGPAGRCMEMRVLLSPNLPRNTARQVASPREMPAPDPWMETQPPPTHRQCQKACKAHIHSFCELISVLSFLRPRGGLSQGLWGRADAGRMSLYSTHAQN